MKKKQDEKNLLLKQYTRREFLLHGLSFLKNLFLFQIMFSNVFSRTSFNLLKSETFLSQTKTESEEDINKKVLIFYHSLCLYDQEDFNEEFDDDNDRYLYIKRDRSTLQKIRSKYSSREAVELVLLEYLKNPWYHLYVLPEEEYINHFSKGIDIVFSDFIEENDFSEDFKKELSRLIEEDKVYPPFLRSNQSSNSYQRELLVSFLPSSFFKYLLYNGKVSNQLLDNIEIESYNERVPYHKEKTVCACKNLILLGISSLVVGRCIAGVSGIVYKRLYFPQKFFKSLTSSLEEITFIYADKIIKNGAELLESNSTEGSNKNTTETVVSDISDPTYIRYIASLGKNNKNHEGYIFISDFQDEKCLKINFVTFDSSKDNIDKCHIFSYLNLNTLRILNSENFVTYDINTSILTININDKGVTYLKDLCFALAGAFVESYSTFIPIVNNYKVILSTGLILILATFFYVQSITNEDKFILEIDLSFIINNTNNIVSTNNDRKNNNSIINSLISYFIARKMPIKFNGTEHHLYIPITMAYAILLESYIIKFLYSISSLFLEKQLICNNEEVKSSEGQ